jgi:hypothetical protein
MGFGRLTEKAKATLIALIERIYVTAMSSLPYHPG